MRAKYICTISQARKIIFGIWAASFLLAVPMLFVQIHLEVGERIKAYWCVADSENLPLWQFHELYMLLLILVIPTSIMVMAYSAICWEVWRVMQRRYDMTSGQALNSGPDGYSARYSKRSTNHSVCSSHTTFRESLSKSNVVKTEEENSTVKQVIKMLVAVVVLFVICWAPLLIYNVLKAYGVIPSNAPGPVKHVGTAFHLMAYFNSCINPLVYGFMSKNFRESFYKALCRCCYRGRLKNRYPSLSHTRTTSVRCHEMNSITTRNGHKSHWASWRNNESHMSDGETIILS